MNIWALGGHRVRVTDETLDNGYLHDSEEIKNRLILNKEYTVAYTKVYSSSSKVCLKEIPNFMFNTVNFEDVIKQSEEDNAKHHDYYLYE